MSAMPWLQQLLETPYNVAVRTFAGRAISAVLVAAVFLPSDSGADVCVYKPPKVQRVCGVMVDPSGIPLSGATVTVLQNGLAVGTVITDESGEFDFDVKQPGKCELDATLAGFQHARYQLTLSKPTSTCKDALQVRMDVGSLHCEGDGIRETKRPLNHER
jgi:hypothetical protein